jgi:hypothetical protein
MDKQPHCIPLLVFDTKSRAILSSSQAYDPEGKKVNLGWDGDWQSQDARKNAKRSQKWVGMATGNLKLRKGLEPEIYLRPEPAVPQDLPCPFTQGIKSRVFQGCRKEWLVQGGLTGFPPANLFRGLCLFVPPSW